MLYRVVLSYAVCGLIVSPEGRVEDAPPLMKWAKGKHINFVKDWVKKKSGSIDLIAP